MSDFFSMGGYAGYVWGSYLVFFVVLVADALAPLWQRHKALRELRGRLKRETARRAA